MLLQFQCAKVCLRLGFNEDSDSVSLGLKALIFIKVNGLSICISQQLPADTDAAELRTTL